MIYEFEKYSLCRKIMKIRCEVYTTFVGIDLVYVILMYLYLY